MRARNRLEKEGGTEHVYIMVYRLLTTTATGRIDDLLDFRSLILYELDTGGVSAESSANRVDFK